MAAIWGELKRRNVVKVAVAYAIVGWVLIEVSATLLPAFEAPDWVLRVIVLIVSIGFVLALVLSWAYEITPDGLKPSHEVEPAVSITHSTGQKLNYIIIGILAVAVGFLLLKEYLPRNSEPEEVVLEPAVQVVELDNENPAPAAPEPIDVLPNSVAVLPFENLSPDPNNAYFAAGLHEEILSQLAKLRNLSVISRTSVLRYSDSEMSIPEIGKELNVGTVMEGSVRYADDRVRITLQLIDAESDEHLWSETYDREFEDIFAIESDIAMNIANALQAEFSLDEQQNIERQPTTSPEAYALFLRAVDMFGDSEANVTPLLDTAIEMDPQFAEAYAYRAVINEMRANAIDPEDVRRALEIDPAMGIAHAMQAVIYVSNGRLAEAQRSFDEADRLSPNDPYLVAAKARYLRLRGEYPTAVELLERATKLDPNNWNNFHQLGIAYRFNRDYDQAVASAHRAIDLDPANATPHTALAYSEIARGNLEEAERELRLAEQLGALETITFRVPQFAYAYAQIGRDDDAARFFDLLETKVSAEDESFNAGWVLANLAIGDSDKAFLHLQAALRNPGINRTLLTEIKANAYRDPVLDEPRFQALRDQIGAL